jgi:sarcosine dehydrogenase
MKHAYVVTERIPGIEKMPNVRDHDASVYLKLQVLVILDTGWEHHQLYLTCRDISVGINSKI